LVFWCGRGIIIGNYGLNFYAFFLRHFYRHLYIHIIPRIITVQTGNPLALICGSKGVKKSRGCRGRTYFSYRNRVAEIFSKVPDKRGFMAAASASYYTDFAGGDIQPLYDPGIIGGCYHITVYLDKTFEHFIDNVIRII
jgi:hypothetical protein